MKHFNSPWPPSWKQFSDVDLKRDSPSVLEEILNPSGGIISNIPVLGNGSNLHWIARCFSISQKILDLGFKNPLDMFFQKKTPSLRHHQQKNLAFIRSALNKILLAQKKAQWDFWGFPFSNPKKKKPSREDHVPEGISCGSSWLVWPSRKRRTSPEWPQCHAQCQCHASPWIKCISSAAVRHAVFLHLKMMAAIREIHVPRCVCHKKGTEGKQIENKMQKARWHHAGTFWKKGWYFFWVEWG